MILNDHSADRQSQSLSMSLRRDKRSKDAVPKWLLACSAAMPRDSPMQSSSAGSAQVSLRVSLDEIRPEFMSVSASIARTFTGCHCMDTIGRAKSVSRPHDGFGVSARSSVAPPNERLECCLRSPAVRVSSDSTYYVNCRNAVIAYACCCATHLRYRWNAPVR